MSFKDCIDNAEKEGVLTKDRADGMRDDFEKTRRELELDYGAGADAEAARRTFDKMKFEALEKRRRELLQAKIGKSLVKAQGAFRNFKGNEDYGEFLINLIEDVGGKLGASSVRGRYHALKGRAHARMQSAIEAFERDALGRTRNKALLRDVVKAAFGDADAPDAAKAIAASWHEASEFLRKRFNAAGGHIGKLENWGLPQSHDGVAVRRAGYERWREEILPRLDLPRMIDKTTGKPFTREGLELALRDVFETITTEGANKIEPSGAAKGRALANRRAEHRFLVFKSGDDWLEYQDRFGQRDAFAAMMGHLDEMARDVAGMEILGPNPLATLRLLTENAEKWAKTLDAKGAGTGITKFDRVRGKTTQAWNMWALHTGEANAPVNGFVARSVRTVRNYLTSAQLGSAALSAVTDIETQRQARIFNGLPQAKQLADVVNLMLPTSKAETADAIRAGLIAEGAGQVALAQARYMGEVDATGVTRWLADTVLRWSLLSPWTQAGRWAFGMEFMGALASRSGKSLAQLQKAGGADAAFARALERHGLSGAWDEIRATAPYQPEKGAAFLRPEDIAQRADLSPERADYLANRVLEMVQAETEFAVPTSTLRGRAAITENIKPGGLAGELIRSVAMYKAFPATITYLIGSRAMQESAARGGGYGLAYLASMTAGLTLFGGLAIQMRELKSGRDPRNMKDPRFWQAAALQGGGLGLFGDFMFANVNRFGGGLGESLSGPVVSAVNTARELTIGNVNQIAKGEDPRLGRDFVKALRGNTPGGNLWYAELVYHRMVLDNLQKWVDPDADEDFRSKIRYREREFGNSFFWAPGETLPERAPALESAVGEEAR